jgi:CheY-like chemotaxis protein
MAHRILLADDSLTIQKVVEITFAGPEWELRAVGSGDKAVSLLTEFDPEVVLADAVMPGLTGYELCEAVKRLPHGSFVPVVILTGTFEPFDRPRAERVGADTVVTKPFDAHAFLALVRDLVVNAKEAQVTARTRPLPLPRPEPEPGPPRREVGEDTGPMRVLDAVPSPEEPLDSEEFEETAVIHVVSRSPEATAPPAAPPVETTAEVVAEPFREAELPLLPSEAPPSPAREADLGGPEDEVPRRDVEADIARYEMLTSARAELPVSAVPVDEAEMVPSSVEIPPAGGPLPERPESEPGSPASGTSLTDRSGIVGTPPPADRPLSKEDVERVARRVVEILGERVVRKVAWDVVPEMAERLVRERLRELERAD